MFKTYLWEVFMKTRLRGLAVAAVVLLVAGCGVPREAGRLATAEVGVLAVLPAEDDAVRRMLAGQPAAWEQLAGLLDRQELGGTAVGEDFRALVCEAAALARRQKELLDAGEDEAALNRAALAKMRAMWGDVARYLGE
jgi:hypothetical protein